MPFTDLTPPPEAPTRSDPPDEFIVKADAFVAWIATHADDLTTFIGELETAAALIAAAPAYSDTALRVIADSTLTPVADRGVYYTSASVAALFTLTSAGRALLDDASTSAQLDTLGFSANGKSLVTAADYAAMRTLMSLYTAAQVDAAVAAARVPAGAIQDFALTSAPTGWLKCNGAAVSRTTYPDLFAAIGTTFGVGNGSTTFNVPEDRGEFRRGLDDGRGIDSGRVLGSHQMDDFKAHDHTLEISSLFEINHDVTDEGDRTVDATGTPTAGYIGSTGGTETRPRNNAYLVCIKT